jgi:predicted secreted Zn-dependent protease
MRPVVRGIVACSAVLAAALAPQAVAGTGPATIRITDVQTSYKLVDAGKRGPSAGDLEIIAQSLYNRRVTTRAIGRANILCTMLGKDLRSCTATYVLPKGSIMTSGVIGSRLIYELAVIGGTELYDNARGSLVVTTTALKPRRQVLVFRLSG